MSNVAFSPSQRPKPRLAIRLIRLLLLSCATLYLVICLVVAAFQRSFIYFPPVFTSQQVDESARSARLERWYDLAGQAIGMKRLSLRQPAAGQVLITYGNGSWSVGSAHYAGDIQNLAALDVFILEYPGYADRAGSPSQRSIFRAADDAFQSLPANKPTFLVGEATTWLLGRLLDGGQGGTAAVFLSGGLRYNDGHERCQDGTDAAEDLSNPLVHFLIACVPLYTGLDYTTVESHRLGDVP